jgi:hypothetical protein
MGSARLKLELKNRTNLKRAQQIKDPISDNGVFVYRGKTFTVLLNGKLLEPE